MPTVSVIIPSYNAGQYLVQAIESCLQQSYGDLEIIVVDDGSTDTTRETVARYPTVHYIYQTNSGGPAGARNTGWKQSHGEFLQFLDADDVLLPTKIERCLEAFQTHPTAGLVYTNMEFRTADLSQVYTNAHVLNWATLSTLPGLLNNISTFAPHCPLIRRQVFNRSEGFNESLRGTEDWFMWISLAAHGAEFYFLDEKLVWYRWTPNSLSRDELGMARARLAAMEALNKLPIPPGLIDLDSKIAERHHVVAVLSWKAYQRAEARQHLRVAISLSRKGRGTRLLLLLLGYFIDYPAAEQILYRLININARRSGTNTFRHQDD